MSLLEPLRATVRRLRRNNTLRAQWNTLLPRNPRMAEKPTLFLHIPKTGGVSLHAFLVRNLRARRPISIVAREELDALSDAQLAAHDLIATHTDISILDRLPPCHTITLLRDPVDRVISSYHFHRADPRDLRLNRFARSVDLRTFVETEDPAFASAIENAQVRQMLPGGRLKGASDEDMLATAMAAIDRFDMVGRLENIDALLARIAAHYGLEAMGAFPHRNKARNQRPGDERYDDSIRAAIRARTALDQALYDAVRARFG